MSRNLGPSCRLCRREGIKLMLKGSRCESAKCPMEKQSRNMPPGGARAFRRTKGTEFGKRLREKQKVKRYYGLFEAQFRNYFAKAQRAKANTGEALMILLERRLDNVITKLGFAPSRKAARVAIVHNHFTVNGARVNRPSYLVEVGDTIGVRKRDASQKLVRSLVDQENRPPVQAWLQVNNQAMEGRVSALPSRDDVQIPVEEKLIVEFCSR